ncbi:hypothetical protein ACTWP5_15465 [Streptomyces sp. 4N509B]|uniref:hypothetical protein n=1 Tax=Streptomyces sp. 4N509B TaxID=3457413 RepID=UPI003FD05589
MSSRHGKACAAGWRERAEDERWSRSDLAIEIARCCGVSRLRAHRLAEGWTLTQACQELRELCERESLACPRVNADQLRVWETGKGRPQRATVDLLCRLYRSNARTLGLETAGDYGATASSATAAPAFLPEPAPSTTAGTVAGEGDWLDALRRSVDRTLASATVTSGQLDLIDERLLLYRERYLTTPPGQMVAELVAALREVRGLAADRQPAAVQVRLSELTAILATLIADSLMKLGLLRQADAWYATARTAADDSGNNDLRAQVRAQAAMLPYYYGPLDRAVRLAHEARLLSQHGSRATTTAAFAAAAEARARARGGDRTGAEKAMRLAQESYAHAAPAAANDAWSFPERRLLLYLSGTLTYLRLDQRARQVRRQAFDLYRAHPGGIDPALLTLDEALCLLHEHHLAEACRLAGQAYTDVPPGHRTPILGTRARNIIEAVPTRLRANRAARELDALLSLPALPASGR